jgi:hypothetical protein
VPGQLLGFSLQVTRLTHLLIQAEAGSRGSLEVLDDVAIEDAHGVTTAVQSKSALTGNPLSDNSAVFWKTLANWADALATGSLPRGKLELVIYVSKPATGSLAKLLAGASTIDAAKAAIAEVRKHFDGNPLPADSGALTHLQRFLGHTPEGIEHVVRAFRIECGSGSPQNDLEHALDNFFFKQGLARQLAALAQGWVKQRVDEMIEKGTPAIIERDEFHREMQAFHTKFVERSILHSFAKGPTPQDVEEHRARIYVRQLEIIYADFEDQMAAISNYFRATSDRTNWGASGVVQKDSFDQLNENLVSTWKNHSKMTGIRDGQRPPTEQGQLLLAECMNHTAPVENLQAPSHFIPGCFHELADKQAIGWHPDYLSELAGKKSGGSH